MLWAVGTPLFKFGIAASPRRIHDVQACSPIELIVVGTVEGSLQTERNIHQTLKRYRVRGEWFRLPESIVWRMASVFGRRDVPPEMLL